MLNSDLATGKYFPQKSPHPILPNLFLGVGLKLLHILNSKICDYLSVQHELFRIFGPTQLLKHALEREMIIQHSILHVHKDLSSIISSQIMSALSQPQGVLQLPFALLTKKNVSIIPHISFVDSITVSGWMQQKHPPHQTYHWKV